MMIRRASIITVVAPWSPRSARRTWLISAALLFAAGALWAFGSPLVSYPDEDAHIVMAAAAGRGEFRGTDHSIRAPDEVGSARTDTVFEVPAAFRDIVELRCFAFKPHVPASCAGTMSTDRSEVSVATRAGRYPPVY